MQSLSSSIVKHSVASMREVEDAMARQMLYGGDLATNLLELAAVDEGKLTPLLAETHGLEPAPTGELTPAKPSTLRLVPGDVAARHALYPMEEADGTLVVAVAEPLPPEVEEDLGFALGVSVEQRVAPMVRIRQALARDYGIALDQRMKRLVARLAGQADPHPSSIPPPLSAAPQLGDLPRPPTVPPGAYLPGTELGSIAPPARIPRESEVAPTIAQDAATPLAEAVIAAEPAALPPVEPVEDAGEGSFEPAPDEPTDQPPLTSASVHDLVTAEVPEVERRKLLEQTSQDRVLSPEEAAEKVGEVVAAQEAEAGTDDESSGLAPASYEPHQPTPEDEALAEQAASALVDQLAFGWEPAETQAEELPGSSDIAYRTKPSKRQPWPDEPADPPQVEVVESVLPPEPAAEPEPDATDGAHDDATETNDASTDADAEQDQQPHQVVQRSGPTASSVGTNVTSLSQTMRALGREQRLEELRRQRPGAPRRQRRGPYTAAMAEYDLREAEDRDLVVQALFDFASQYFGYTALFAVQGDLAEGREARGAGASRAKLRGIGVPLDLPSALSKARKAKTHLLLRLEKEGLDASFAKDLERPLEGVCFFLPIFIRGHCVLIVYGDEGKRDVDLSSVGAVIALAPLVSAALERVILKKKLAEKGDAPASMPLPPLGPLRRPKHAPPPPAEERAAALARALQDQVRNLDGPNTVAATPHAKDHPEPEAAEPEAAEPEAAEPEAGSAQVELPSDEPERDASAAAEPDAGAPKVHPEASVEAASSAEPSRPPAEPPQAAVSPASIEPLPTVAVGSTEPADEASSDSEQPIPLSTARSKPPKPPADSPERRGTPPQGTPSQVERLALERAAREAAEDETSSPPASSPEPKAEAFRSSPSAAVSPSQRRRRHVQAPSSQFPPRKPVSEPPVFPLTRRSLRPKVPVAPDVWDALGPAEASTKPGVGSVPPSGALDDRGPATRRSKPAPAPEPSAPDSAVPESILDDPDSGPDISVSEVDERASYPDIDGEALSGAPLAPSSRKMRVAPKAAPFSHESAEARLPKVIVSTEEKASDLVERLLGGEQGVEARLIDQGAAAISALVKVFPGPITSQPKRGTGEGPTRASECGPVLRCLARIGTAAAPFVSVRSGDRDASVRTWATRLLGEMPTVEGARAVARRIDDDDEGVRRAALAAGRLMQDDDDARDALRELVGQLTQEREELAHAAIEYLASLRDGRAVPTLIELLEHDNQNVVQSSHWALVVLTRHDFGSDTVRWSNWWVEHGRQHRVEWLIEALMSDSQDLRQAAGEELKATTKEYFGYYDDLPAKERARAQERYREWWITKGKARFRS